jgi:hypothetical protein
MKASILLILLKAFITFNTIKMPVRKDKNNLPDVLLLAE